MMKFALLAAVIALSGCASPMKANVEPSNDRQKLATTQVRIADIRFVNKAVDAEFTNNFFGDSYIPIKADPSTRQNVENDIRRLLGELLVPDPTAPLSLLVRIEQADALWAFGVADRILLVNLVTAGSEREFVMNVKFSIEVERSGKVMATYKFDEKVTSRGSAGLESSVRESYVKLFSVFRQTLGNSLRSDFLARYL